MPEDKDQAVAEAIEAVEASRSDIKARREPQSRPNEKMQSDGRQRPVMREPDSGCGHNPAGNITRWCLA